MTSAKIWPAEKESRLMKLYADPASRAYLLDVVVERPDILKSLLGQVSSQTHLELFQQRHEAQYSFKSCSFVPADGKER